MRDRTREIPRQNRFGGESEYTPTRDSPPSVFWRAISDDIEVI